MLLQRLVTTSQALAATSGRLRKTAIAADYLRDLADDERRCGTAFLAGALPHGKVGVGPAALARCSVVPAPRAVLSIGDLDRALAGIADVAGRGAGGRRLAMLNALMARATAKEQAFIRRLLRGELRQGALEGIVMDAVARAAGIDKAPLRRATMLGGDLPQVAAAALGRGESGLAGFRLQLFRPLQPMLAQPVADIAGALSGDAERAFEVKLDGARVQIHRDAEGVRVFTRRLNDVTDSVPEIVAAVASLPLRQVVLDGEAVACGDGGRPRPFEVTMTRFGRRRDVDAMRHEIPLSLSVFDCLHLDGEDLIDKPYRHRVGRLDDLLPPSLRVDRRVTADAGEAAEFLQRALLAGHEGVMVKSPDAPYQAGNRGGDWLKLKPVHTLDLVVLAAEWGSGRRRGTLSNLHLGARDPQSGGYVMLGKTFKGLTDATLHWQTRQLLERETGRDGNVVRVRPELVVEVAFNGLQHSPQYPAGLALRFARVKGYRPDKPAGDADTIDTVRRIQAAGQGALAQ